MSNETNQKPQQRKPTENQEKFSEHIVGQLAEGKKPNGTKAAREALNAKYPSETAYQMMRSPTVQNEIQSMLEMAGLTRSALIWKLKEFIMDSDDPAIQARMWDRAAEIYGLMPSKVNQNLNVKVDGKQFMDKLRKKAQDSST